MQEEDEQREERKLNEEKGKQLWRTAMFSKDMLRMTKKQKELKDRDLFEKQTEQEAMLSTGSSSSRCVRTSGGSSSSSSSRCETTSGGEVVCRGVIHGADDENDFYANTQFEAAFCGQFAVCQEEEENLEKGMKTQDYDMKNLKMLEDAQQKVILIKADAEDESMDVCGRGEEEDFREHLPFVGPPRESALTWTTFRSSCRRRPDDEETVPAGSSFKVPRYYTKCEVCLWFTENRACSACGIPLCSYCIAKGHDCMCNPDYMDLLEIKARLEMPGERSRVDQAIEMLQFEGKKRRVSSLESSELGLQARHSDGSYQTSQREFGDEFRPMRFGYRARQDEFDYLVRSSEDAARFSVMNRGIGGFIFNRVRQEQMYVRMPRMLDYNVQKEDDKEVGQVEEIVQEENNEKVGEKRGVQLVASSDSGIGNTRLRSAQAVLIVASQLGRANGEQFTLVIDVDQSLIIAILLAAVIGLVMFIISRNPRTGCPLEAEEPQDMEVEESNFADEVEEERRRVPQPAQTEQPHKRRVPEEGHEETFTESFEERKTKSARTMSTQSQVKYTWWTTHPRFTPRCERPWCMDKHDGV